LALTVAGIYEATEVVAFFGRTSDMARGGNTLGAQTVDLAPVARIVTERHGASPCAVVGFAWRARPAAAAGVVGRAEGWCFGWGAAGKLWTEPPPGVSEPPPEARTSHIFDLASLTKPVVALLLARLHREGEVDRMAPLGSLLPALKNTPSGEVPLDALTAHRAGLEAHRLFYEPSASARQPALKDILFDAAAARRPECAGAWPGGEGFPPIYSDLGYILVGAALEAATGEALDALIEDEVTGPLGLKMGSIRRLRQHLADVERLVVPTEQSPWRGGVIRARVHDNNAHVIAGEGTAGHAGLFADVWSVVKLGCGVLDAWAGRRDDWLRREDLLPLLRPRPGGSHAAGFDRRSGPRPSSGTRFGPASFGHLGYTGTSIWIDPEASFAGVLLTNRVHPSAGNIAIRQARPAAYDAMVARIARG